MAQQAYSSKPTNPLKKAWRWDKQLPKPLVLFLILDLLLLLPIPFLLPGAWEPQPIVEEPQLEPIIISMPAPPTPTIVQNQASALEIKHSTTLLITPEKLQAAGGYSTNVIASLLSHFNPELASITLDVGGGFEQSLASVITGQALRWNINPAVLLTLFDTQGLWLSQPLSPTQPLTYALRGPQTIAGLDAQITWAALELRAGLLEEQQSTFTLLDGSTYDVPKDLDQANYALLRFLAQTHTAEELAILIGSGQHSWSALAEQIMGDPRKPSYRIPDDKPFLTTPFQGILQPAARFDHHWPLVEQDQSMLGGDHFLELGYDGHNAWDYLLPEGTPIQAAAAGEVLFSGWINSGCRTPAGVVVLQHTNGYRTSYWHLSNVEVYPDQIIEQGELIGISGNSGCSTTPHLHFGVQRLGRDIDPYGWCRTEPDPWAEHQAGTRSFWLWQDQRDPCSLGPQAILVDETHRTWVQTKAVWHTSSAGNWGSAWYNTERNEEALITWRPEIPLDRTYRVLAFISEKATNAGTARYRIQSGDGTVIYDIDQAVHAGSWMNLGSYRFLPGQRGAVELYSTEDEGIIWADALAWIPIEP